MIIRSVLIGLIITAGCLNSLYAQSDVIRGAAGIEFVKIPAGSFVYGKFEPPYPRPSGDTPEHEGYNTYYYSLAKEMATRDARPGFKVQLDSFYMGKYEVTQQQWQQVMGNNPSFFKGDLRPVENISWKEAQEFVRRLTETDKNYCYRLPDEFEWEYVARAGAAEDIPWSDIREQAHLGTKETAEIGSKKPNGWGLYDMLGNVWEWTADWYNEKTFADSVPATQGTQHVLKGASFTGDVKNATYMTHAAGPGNKWDVGFRVVMEPKDGNCSAKPTKKSFPAAKRQKIPGWHVSRTTHQGTTPAITFENGIITLEQNPYGQGGVLLTDSLYEDFELTAEVKIDSFSNGGIFLRATESGQAYQVELAEPGGTGNLLGEMLRISKPAVAANKSKVWKPGKWNHFRIRMTGATPRIALWINGELMWDVQQPENDFVAGATKGMIGLQTHWSATYSEASKAFDLSSSWRPGSKHQFRNIRIKRLK